MKRVGQETQGPPSNAADTADSPVARLKCGCSIYSIDGKAMAVCPHFTVDTSKGRKLKPGEMVDFYPPIMESLRDGFRETLAEGLKRWKREMG